MKITSISSKRQMTTTSISMTTSRGTVRGITRIMRAIMPDANDKERQQIIILVEQEVVSLMAEVEIKADTVICIKVMKGEVIRKVGAVVRQVI